MVVPVAVADDVAVRPAEPDAVDELVCEAVMLRKKEERAAEHGKSGRWWRRCQ